MILKMDYSKDNTQDKLKTKTSSNPNKFIH